MSSRGTIFNASTDLTQKRPEQEWQQALSYFYVLGLNSLSLFAGSISGLITIFGVHFYFLSSGAYDSYGDGHFPDYANAITNLFIRLPLWFLGTLLITGLCLVWHPARGRFKRLGLFIVYLFFYFSLLIGTILFSVMFRGVDIYFSGFFGLLVLPNLILMLVSIVNPFRVTAKNTYSRRDYVWISIGVATFALPIFFMVQTILSALR